MLVNTDKRASIFINHEQLRTMLKLPDGMSILAMQASFDPPGVNIIVTSYDLEEVIPNVQAPPLAGGSWNRTIESVQGADGFAHLVHWEWEPPAPNIPGHNHPDTRT